MIQHVNFDMEWVISVIFCCWLALFAYRLKPRQNNPDKHFRSKSISFTHPSLALTPWQRQWFNPGPCKSQALLWGGPPNWDKWESFPEGGLWNAEQVCQWPLTSCFYRHESWPHVNPCSSVAFPTWLWSPLMVFPMVPLPPIRFSGVRGVCTLEEWSMKFQTSTWVIFIIVG